MDNTDTVDHGESDGGRRKRHPNPFQKGVNPFRKQSDLEAYPYSLSMDMSEEEVRTRIGDCKSCTEDERAAVLEHVFYLQQVVVQQDQIPSEYAAAIADGGYEADTRYAHREPVGQNDGNCAFGQTAQFRSPASVALQSFLNLCMQKVDPMYATCGVPCGKGGLSRNCSSHLDYMTRRGFRALGHRYTLMQIVLGPFIMWWSTGDEMVVRILDHTVLQRCVHYASSCGGGASVSLIATSQLPDGFDYDEL
jgi:hypothetical protein